ncbi:BAH_G0051230.mRNA.1.CDS.1 [Saccharomyces cerevisiae]|nr:SX2_G0035360.mRNA.1.CDS.1 [Saccharomyces cerevisiae]CAD6650836.1 HLJ1_G0040770.mRNA.1.CDS.1 [Saccharomyces cerevisiae]CAI4773594.1 BAH_G0051230.mRNA.1.CDS.1 [Saccharomyces cerevisiae]CAI4776058.1 BAG_1a_G0051220.mRNA.1.CDS.1 [Saccharomyces cerevisiae]CAI4785147.1 BAK_1a_G0051470.mRNA.1.CDS.1 [Saccharomyces cerevisiae]
MDMLLELLLPVYARLNESGWLLWFVFHDVYEAVEMSTEESVHTRVINIPDILSTQQMRQGPSQTRTPLVMLLT